jgi:hypothetical protein
MCKCTPEIKTPFCGRPGCEWPPQKAPEAKPAIVKSIVGEIAAMEYAGDIKGIACVVVDRDGDLRTLVAYNEGTKLTIIAGTGLLQHQVIAEARTFNKARD